MSESGDGLLQLLLALIFYMFYQIQRELQLRIEAQGQSLQKMIEAQAKAGGIVLNYRPECPANEPPPSTNPSASAVLALESSQGAPTGHESSQVKLVDDASPPLQEPTTKISRVEMQPLVIVPDPAYMEEMLKKGLLGTAVQAPEPNGSSQAPTSSLQAGGVTSMRNEGGTEAEGSSIQSRVGDSQRHGCMPQHGSIAPKFIQASERRGVSNPIRIASN